MPTAETHRVCPQCGKRKRKDLFLSNHARICNTCRKATSAGKRAVQLSTDENRARHLLSRYGLHVEDIFQMRCDQGNKCKCCHTEFNQAWYHIKIDHDHRTGQVRGLLCNLCNATIVRAVEQTADPLTTAENLLAYITRAYLIE
jgi:hypothetical protein